MAAEIGHQVLKRVVVVGAEKVLDPIFVADVVPQLLAPMGTALEGQRRIEVIGAGVDPFLQDLAAGALEGLHHALAVFQRHHGPAGVAEGAVDPAEHAVGDDGVEALAVVVDDPPAVPEVVLAAFQQRLVHIAFVHFGVTDDGNHAARVLSLNGFGVAAQVVLGQGREHGHRRTEADGAGGDIDVV